MPSSSAFILVSFVVDICIQGLSIPLSLPLCVRPFAGCLQSNQLHHRISTNLQPAIQELQQILVFYQNVVTTKTYNINPSTGYPIFYTKTSLIYLIILFSRQDPGVLKCQPRWIERSGIWLGLIKRVVSMTMLTSLSRRHCSTSTIACSKIFLFIAIYFVDTSTLLLVLTFIPYNVQCTVESLYKCTFKNI